MYSSYSVSNTTDLTDAEAAGLLGSIMAVMGVVWILGLAVGIIMVIAMWKVFTKAGKKGWYALIPFLNTYTLGEVAGIKGWMALVAPFAGIVPFVGGIATLAFSIYMMYCIAKVFGKGAGFTVGLIFFSPIFMAILGFGSANYLGAGASPAKTTFLASDEANTGAGAGTGAAAAPNPGKKDEWVDGKQA